MTAVLAWPRSTTDLSVATMYVDITLDLDLDL
jgi:hypothetical protein